MNFIVKYKKFAAVQIVYYENHKTGLLIASRFNISGDSRCRYLNHVFDSDSYRSYNSFTIFTNLIEAFSNRVGI